jgi:hypothetical protein
VSAVSALKDKFGADTLAFEGCNASAASTSTVTGNNTLKRKGSSDNIIKSTPTTSGLRDPLPMSPIVQLCDWHSVHTLVTSRGELGPWVGVEVPIGDSWTLDNKPDGPQWNDGRESIL